MTTVRFKLLKETVRTGRYEGISPSEGQMPAIHQVYIEKWALPYPLPERVVLTLSIPGEPGEHERAVRSDGP